MKLSLFQNSPEFWNSFNCVYGECMVKNSREAGAVYATQNGKVLHISEMPDDVFAAKVLGDGVCIVPEDGKVFAPVSGIVESADDTGHAYGIASNDGADIMVHIGVDTVELAGKGFKPNVKTGQSVNAGDLLCTADIGKIKKAGYETHTAVLLCNPGDFDITETAVGKTAQGGQTVVFRYRKKNP
jgi:glucose-specific phosphotransferase system IIA component